MIKLIISVSLAGSLLQAFEYAGSNPTTFPLRFAVQDKSIPGAVLNPSILPLLDYTYLFFSGCRPYCIDELSSAEIYAGTTVDSFSVQCLWSEFGMEEYRENRIEFAMAFPLCGIASYGIRGGYKKAAIDMPDYKGSFSVFDFDAGVSFYPFKPLLFSFEMANCVSLWNEKNRTVSPAEFRFGAALIPFRGLMLIYNVNRSDGEFINAFQLSVKLLKCFAVVPGYSPELLTSSVSAVFIYKNLCVSFGFRYHEFLGYTCSVSCCITSQQLSFNGLGYINKNVDLTLPQKKTDINSCTEDQIRSIPVLKKTHADQIIKYRKIIGPLSVESLYRIGMLPEDVYALFDYTFGYEEQKKTPERKMSAWERRDSVRRNIFRRLTSKGLPASVSLEVADLAGFASYKQICFYIDSLTVIDQNKKDMAKLICREYVR